MAKKYFDIPVTVGIQGGVRQFCFTLEMRMLEHLIKIDDSGNTMERSQRPVNFARTQKITKYVTDSVTNKTPYILPTISGNIEGEANFTPFEGFENAGILRLYRGANIKFFDGQHRATSIDTVVSLCPRLRDTVSVLLTDNADLPTRQQFFSDINYNAVKPSVAQNLAYDKRNSINALALYVTQDCYPFTYIIDFEKNVISGANFHLFSFKALHDCMVKMYSLNDKSVITDEMKEDASKIMMAWSQKMFWGVISGRGAPGYRQRYIGTHAVMIVAIGLATRYLLENRSADEIVELLNLAEFHYEKSFVHEDWVRRCVDPDTWKMKCDGRSIKLTASLLLQLLEVVLPEELKQLEIDTFGTDPEMFRTSEGPEVYTFKEDRDDAQRAELPANSDVWRRLLNNSFSEELNSLKMPQDYIDIKLAKDFSEIEEDLVFKITREELISRLKEIVANESVDAIRCFWNKKTLKYQLRIITQ